MNAKPTTSFLYRTTQLKSGYWRHSVTTHKKHRAQLQCITRCQATVDSRGRHGFCLRECSLHNYIQKWKHSEVECQMKESLKLRLHHICSKCKCTVQVTLRDNVSEIFGIKSERQLCLYVTGFHKKCHFWEV
jgi:hypothetical protein